MDWKEGWWWPKSFHEVRGRYYNARKIHYFKSGAYVCLCGAWTDPHLIEPSKFSLKYKSCKKCERILSRNSTRTQEDRV